MEWESSTSIMVSIKKVMERSTVGSIGLDSYMCKNAEFNQDY